MAETLGTSCGRSASNRRSSVDLPTPEGPEMTTSCPGASLILLFYPTAVPVEKWGGLSGSLDVRRLFADSLDLRLQIDHRVGNCHID